MSFLIGLFAFLGFVMVLGFFVVGAKSYVHHKRILNNERVGLHALARHELLQTYFRRRHQ